MYTLLLVYFAIFDGWLSCSGRQSTCVPGSASTPRPPPGGGRQPWLSNTPAPQPLLPACRAERQLCPEWEGSASNGACTWRGLLLTPPGGPPAVRSERACGRGARKAALVA